jgi:hypothetical protein
MQVWASVSTSAGFACHLFEGHPMGAPHRGIHGLGNFQPKLVIPFFTPHQRQDDALLGGDSSIEVAEGGFGGFPIENGRMTRMSDDTSDVVASRQLTIQRRRRIQSHEQARDALTARPPWPGSIRPIRHRQDHHSADGTAFA